MTENNVSVITNRPESFLEIGWDTFESVDDSIMRLNSEGVIGLDTETTGLSSTLHKLHCIQLGCREFQHVIDTDTVDIKQYKKLIEESSIIMHNGMFDLTFLYKQGIVPRMVYDTYLAEYVLTMGMILPRGSRGLGGVIKKYVGVDIDKSQQASIADTGILNKEAILYSANDVKYLQDVANSQHTLIIKKGLTETVRLENRFSRVLAYMEHCGVKVDKNKWMSNVRKCEYEEYKTWEVLSDYWKEITPNSPDPIFPDFPINWLSSKQVVEAFSSIGINTFNEAEQKHSVEEGFISKSTHPIIPLYLDYRGANKRVTTYGREWVNNVMPDGRVHTKYKPMVDTGRTACGDTKSGPFPNMQNLPALPLLRSCFVADSRNSLIICDYSSQESVLLADMSQEPNLLEFYLTGGADLHSYTAMKIWPQETAGHDISEIKHKFKDLRQNAKAANFAIAYGGSGFTIAENLGIPPEVGNQVYEAYMQAFPKLGEYFEKKKKEAFNDGYILINNITGRKRFVDRIDDVRREFREVDWSRYKKDAEYKEQVLPIIKRKSAIERESLNAPVQGTAADMSKRAGILFFDWILENKLFDKVKIVIFIHDEWVVECNKSEAEEVGRVLQECMESAGKEFLTRLTIKAEPEISQVWEK